MKETNDVVDAIHDLTRVTIAISESFGSKAETIRKLDELAIPPGRIAAILAMDSKDVASTLAKAKKRKRKGK